MLSLLFFDFLLKSGDDLACEELVYQYFSNRWFVPRHVNDHVVPESWASEDDSFLRTSPQSGTNRMYTSLSLLFEVWSSFLSVSNLLVLFFYVDLFLSHSHTLSILWLCVPGMCCSHFVNNSRREELTMLLFCRYSASLLFLKPLVRLIFPDMYPVTKLDQLWLYNLQVTLN